MKLSVIQDLKLSTFALELFLNPKRLHFRNRRYLKCLKESKLSKIINVLKSHTFVFKMVLGFENILFQFLGENSTLVLILIDMSYSLCFLFMKIYFYQK